MPEPTPAPAAAPERHRVTRREVGVAALVWGAYGVLGWASWLFDHHAFTFQTVVEQLIGSALEAVVWLGLTFPILALAEGWTRGERTRWVRVTLAAVGTAALMGTAHLVVRDMAHVPVAPATAEGPPLGAHRTGPFWLGMLNALALYLAVFGAGLSQAYARQAQLRRDEAARRDALLRTQREESARREATLQAELAEARLDALRRQLDPHFLFNTLNAISALVARDPAGVRSMIARLSELLRFSFDSSDRAEIPLREELALVGRYVEIMQVRLQGRLVVERRVDPGVLDTPVPTMILQPLVENAIRHGVERRKGVGQVCIEAFTETEEVVLRVTDDGPGPSDRPARAAGTAGAARRGIGVANTEARLAHLYGDRATFTLARGAAGGAVAELRLPRRATVAAA